MNIVLAWRRERLPMLLFGMLSVYLGLAASGVRDTIQVDTLLVFAMQVFAAWCLVAAFRILDDIADRPLDAVRTPDRVLVGVSDLRPFWFAARRWQDLVIMGRIAAAADQHEHDCHVLRTPSARIITTRPMPFFGDGEIIANNRHFELEIAPGALNILDLDWALDSAKKHGKRAKPQQKPRHPHLIHRDEMQKPRHPHPIHRDEM